MNNFVFSGNVVRDVEVKEVGESGKLAKFTLVVDGAGDRDVASENPNRRKGGFFQIEAWGKSAEFVEKYIKKGSALSISGDIEHHTWTNEEGKTSSTVRFVAQKFKFAPKNRAEESGETVSEAVGAAAGASSIVSDPFEI